MRTRQWSATGENDLRVRLCWFGYADQPGHYYGSISSSARYFDSVTIRSSFPSTWQTLPHSSTTECTNDQLIAFWFSQRDPTVGQYPGGHNIMAKYRDPDRTSIRSISLIF